MGIRIGTTKENSKEKPTNKFVFASILIWMLSCNHTFYIGIKQKQPYVLTHTSHIPSAGISQN